MNASRREVVVTGMGTVCPFGVGVESLWNGVSAGHSGIDWIQSLGELDPENYPVRFGGELRGIDIDKVLAKHCEVRVEKSVQMGLVAAQEALWSAGLLTSLSVPTAERPVVATIVGSGHGPCREAEAGYEAFFTRGARAMRPTTIPKSVQLAVEPAFDSLRADRCQSCRRLGLLVGDRRDRPRDAVHSPGLGGFCAARRLRCTVYPSDVRRLDQPASAGPTPRTDESLASVRRSSQRLGSWCRSSDGSA